MKFSEFKFPSRHKLDLILFDLCQLIIKNQKKDPDFYGMVGACVLDPDGNMVSSTSFKKKNKWVHAERAAIDIYERKYGEIPQKSIIITTLSPCNESIVYKRYKSSCLDYIKSKKISKIYCGYIDPTQQDNKEFNQKITRIKEIKKICKTFADTFLKDENYK
jgi:pyrimidine deaminase RibD-like protein